MASISTVVLLLFCLTFALWFIALVTPGWAVFKSDSTNWFGIDTQYSENEYQMSISYLRVCNDGGCEVHPYKQTVNIFFNAFMFETQVETFLAIVASGICCIVLMCNLKNPTSTKAIIVAFIFLFAEIMECIVAIKLIAPSILFAGLSNMSFKTPYSAILAAVGILTGVSGWVMNFVQYNSMRNQVTQSPTYDQPISLNNAPTRGNDAILANGSKSDQV